MVAFNVVRERNGWAVRIGDRMTTPFRSRNLAIREANCLAEAIRRHGQLAQVIVEGPDSTEAAAPDAALTDARPGAFVRPVTPH